MAARMQDILCVLVKGKDEIENLVELANRYKLRMQVIGNVYTKNLLFYRILFCQTASSFKIGASLAKKEEVDFLLRYAGTTQISKAISIYGMKQEKENLAVLFGEKKLLSKIRGFKRIRKGKLTAYELSRIEKASLLVASRFRRSALASAR